MPNKSKRQSIYLSPTLRGVYDEAEEKETGFSRLLTEYIERYQIMVRLVKLPELTDHEKMILGEVVSGSMVTPEMLVAMDWSINDAELGTAEEKAALIRKVKALRPAERMALVDMIANLGGAETHRGTAYHDFSSKGLSFANVNRFVDFLRDNVKDFDESPKTISLYLRDVADQYSTNGAQSYELRSAETKSGNPVVYRYNVENTENETGGYDTKFTF